MWCSVLQCGAVCCNVLQCVQCVAVFCSVLRCVSVFSGVLQCYQGSFGAILSTLLMHNSVCCSVWQRLAASYSVLQCVAVCCRFTRGAREAVLSALSRHHSACCSVSSCSVLQCVAVCCNVLQRVAVIPGGLLGLF